MWSVLQETSTETYAPGVFGFRGVQIPSLPFQSKAKKIAGLTETGVSIMVLLARVPL